MPETNQLIVADTTPLIALAMIGQLDLLTELYGQITIPIAVRDEVLAGGAHKIGVRKFRQSKWIRVIALNDPPRADLLSGLDRGEAEAIALTQELSADLLLVDERLARRHAIRLGITITGTLGVLLKAKSLGRIEMIRPLIEQLMDNGIRLNQTIVTQVLMLAGE